MTRLRLRNERGALAIEFMLVLGMFVVVFLVMLQYAVREHAERIASAAAEEGLAAAAAYDGSAEDGRRAAEQYVHGLSPALQNASVSVTRSATSARVEVTGEVEQLAPFLPVRVTVEVRGPVERFVGDGP